MDDELGSSAVFLTAVPSSIQHFHGYGPRSLFAVLHYAYRDPPYFSILQLDLQEPKLKTIMFQKEDIIRFNQEPQGGPSIRWLFSPCTATEDLYMVPNWGFDNPKPFHGFKLNLRTRICQPITPPLSSLKDGFVVTLKGRIYFLAHDWFSYKEKQSAFQCYDPEQNLWNPLEPFPHDPTVSGDIVGTAVLGDTIVFNVDSRNIWAYDVIQNKWYPVKVEDTLCYGFIGEAVVRGETIYALTNRSFYRILELSIKKRGTDLVCSLFSDHFVPDIKLISEQCEAAWVRTRHLLHFGNDNFCLVQSCNFSCFMGYQPIQLTYMKFKNGNWMTGKNLILKVRVQEAGLGSERFEFTLCFSVPAETFFNLKPYPEKDYASYPVQEEEIVTPVQEEEIVTPVQEEEIVIPVQEEEIVTAVQEEEIVIPVQEEEIVTAIQEEEIVTLHKDGLHALPSCFGTMIHHKQTS